MFRFNEKKSKHFLLIIISHHVHWMIFHHSDKTTINVLIASVHRCTLNGTTQFQQKHYICRMSTGSE